MSCLLYTSKEYSKWKANRVYVNKDAQKLIILEPSKEYTREDGTKGCLLYTSLRMEYNRIAMFFAPAPGILAATSKPSKLIRTICSAASPPVFILYQSKWKNSSKADERNS